jgi:hypothetical protein
MLTHYQSSKGPLEIATMPLSYAKNARNKLARTEPERTAEIEALSAHVEKLEAEAKAVALAAGEENPRAVIGGNNPPADEQPSSGVEPKWEAVKVHLDDLLTEAQNWADGASLENQAQADEVARLRQNLQQGAAAADAARIAEKKPLDEQIAEIQDRYNAYIAPLKNKKPGSVSTAVSALGNLLTAWLNKLEAEKRDRERVAREEEERARAAALEAHKEAAASTDLAEIEQAAAMLDHAEEAAKARKAIEKQKVQAQGEVRAVGMRSYWKAVPIEGEGGKALVYYSKRQTERVKAFLQTLADEDVRAGIRSIPGFEVVEERRVA